MDFFEFLFPEQSQAQSLRRIAHSARIANSRANAQREDIDELREENRDLRLYLTALMQAIIDKGLLTLEEIQRKVMSLLPMNPAPPAEAVTESPFPDLKLK